MRQRAASMVTVVTIACLVSACAGQQDTAAGDDGAALATTTTSTTLVFVGASTTTVAEAATTSVGGGATVEEGYCATGVYELDGDALLADVAAASGEGGSGTVTSGAVVMELRDDLTAVVDFQEWTFRLAFPGSSDTVVGTQTGQVTGTWNVDDQGAHTIDLSTESVTATFALETAQGAVPVPAGEKLAPLGAFPLQADCRDPDLVVLQAEDVALGTTIDWRFIRRAP